MEIQQVKDIGLTVNSVDLLGLVTAPPASSGEWVTFELLTQYYNRENGENVEIRVPVGTRNTRDMNVLKQYVPENKQLFIRGSLLTWTNQDGTVSSMVVPSVIKFGIQGKPDFIGLDHNAALLIGRQHGNIVITPDNQWMVLQLVAEFVEKTDNGYEESIVYIPVAYENTPKNQAHAEKYLMDGRQLKIQAEYRYHTGVAGSIIPGFVSKVMRLGVKP